MVYILIFTLILIVAFLFYILVKISRNKINQASTTTGGTPPQPENPIAPAPQQTIEPRNIPNWLLLLGPIVAIVIIHFIMKQYFPMIFAVWFKSFAFWVTVISIAFAVILSNFVIIRSFWYIILLYAIPIVVIYLEFSAHKKDLVKSENQNEQIITTPKVTDTIPRDLISKLVLTMSPGEEVEFVMPPNCVVTDKRSDGYLQTITTDSLGMKTHKTVGDVNFAPAGTAVFKVVKGGPVKVKIWKSN
jgi:hypothetical protein